MPIYLTPPAHQPGGPDGQGWNRLSLNAHMGPVTGQCALRPRTYATLFESRRDTRHATFGNYGPCTREGACTDCPLFQGRHRRELRSFMPRVLVRLEPRTDTTNGLARQDGPDQPWVMNKPDDGWSSNGELWSWEQLQALNGWKVGRPHRDEHSDGFWLDAETSHGGIYGRRATATNTTT